MFITPDFTLCTYTLLIQTNLSHTSLRQFGLIACIFTAHHISSNPPFGPGIPIDNQLSLETAEDHIRHHLLRSTPQVKTLLAFLLEYQLYSAVDIPKPTWISPLLKWAELGADVSALPDITRLVRNEEKTDIKNLISQATQSYGVVQFRQDSKVVDIVRMG